MRYKLQHERQKNRIAPLLEIIDICLSPGYNIQNITLTIHKISNIMTSKELIKKLKKDGWRVIRIKGSHYILKKEDRIEVVPFHSKDLPKGLVDAISKRTGLAPYSKEGKIND